MNVKIGAEAALFPEKEYINGIAVAVHLQRGQVQKYIHTHISHQPSALLWILIRAQRS
jgi:hypothetical protein